MRERSRKVTFEHISHISKSIPLKTPLAFKLARAFILFHIPQRKTNANLLSFIVQPRAQAFSLETQIYKFPKKHKKLFTMIKAILVVGK